MLGLKNTCADLKAEMHAAVIDTFAASLYYHSTCRLSAQIPPNNGNAFSSNDATQGLTKY